MNHFPTTLRRNGVEYPLGNYGREKWLHGIPQLTIGGMQKKLGEEMSEPVGLTPSYPPL